MVGVNRFDERRDVRSPGGNCSRCAGSRCIANELGLGRHAWEELILNIRSAASASGFVGYGVDCKIIPSDLEESNSPSSHAKMVGSFA